MWIRGGGMRLRLNFAQCSGRVFTMASKALVGTMTIIVGRTWIAATSTGTHMSIVHCATTTGTATVADTK